MPAFTSMKHVSTTPLDTNLRTKTFFAWLPVTVSSYANGQQQSETRWLERVTVIYSEERGYWCPLYFVDNEQR